MKSRFLAFIAIAFILSGCTKNLDLSYFSMDMPAGWDYQPGNGTDSFVGTITTSSGTISFEYSTKGYASSLISTEQQYLSDQKNWATSLCYFCEPGVNYVPTQDVDTEKKRLASKDTAVVKVEPTIEYTKSIYKPEGIWRKYYPGADYLAELRYKDSTIFVPIRIPQSIKKHNLHIDTTAQFIVKTVSPKVGETGTTGVYYKSRSTALNFNIKGEELSAEDQEKALKAFKTIKLREE
ncbi:MAG: hypothetical protein ABIN91_15740 [Mucilaginibacter sp.]|uniref:hypothetical protein n=1 Tax=Mucilaginibacter sp. TaxID=1882438 RepID=UPI003267F0A4